MAEGLSFATAIDISGFDEGLKNIEDGIKNAAKMAEGQSEKIQSLFTDIPTIDIKSITNIPETADQIGEAYAQIEKVTRINKDAIRELDAEYQKLTADINKYQNIPEKKDDVKKWREERSAILQNISLRQEIIDKTKEFTKIVDQNAKSLDSNIKVQNNVKSRIKEIIAEMANLRNEAHMNGQTINESTGRYRELAEELGRLKDIQGDVATQAKILSNDENQFQGVISGLSGLSGGFSAAQGAMALFGSENENLQEVMTKLQAVMAITIGLQQVQQMLNKDSAFRLVTLNSLRSLWNKLTGETNAVTAMENTQKATNISLTESQTTAEEANTAAEQANSAARMANNKAMQAGVSGKIADANSTKTATAALNADTAAQNIHTGAVKAGTLATKALTLSTKILKAALISTGIGALIWGVGELVGWITKLIDKENEAKKRTDELNKINSSGYEVYAKESLAIKETIRSLDNFNGSKEQEKKKVKELNSKYGEALGYYNSVAEWQKVLSEKGNAYAKHLEFQAKRQAILNKYTEDYVKLLELNHKTQNNQLWTDDEKKWFDTNFYKTQEGKYRNYWQDELDNINKLEAAHSKKYGFDEIHLDPSKNTSGNGKTFDSKEALRKSKEAEKQFKEELEKFIKKNNDDIAQADIDSMQDGLDKEIKAIQKRTQDLKYQWEQSFLQIAKSRQEVDKSIYLNQKGHTLEGWEKTERGKMSARDYLNNMLNDPENIEFTKQYYLGFEQLMQDEERKIARIKQNTFDQLIELYGSLEEKEEVITRKWMDIMNNLPKDMEHLKPQIIKAMDLELDKLGVETLKKSLNWEEVFGNMDTLATSSLEALKDKLQKTLKSIDSPEAAKTITDAIKNIDKELAGRNPFTNLKNSLTNLITANTKVKEAQEAYNKALATGNSLEIKAAENTLNAAKNTKQKALAEATSAIQASVDKVKEYFGIATALTNTLGELGVEIPEQLAGFMDGMGQVLDGLSKIDLKNPVSIITGGITAIGGLIKGIGSFFNNDSQHQKNIEKLQNSISSLQKAYDKLEESASKVYSKDRSKIYEQENKNLEKQKSLIQAQIQEEQAKKNSDENKIKEWKEQIDSINDKIKENKELALDAIFGSDLKSAIENFASAYAEAWANGEDRAKSAKDTVKKMMQDMVQTSIKSAIQSSKAMEDIREKLREFYADNVLSGWEQDYIYSMAENLQKELDQQFGWADSLMKDSKPYTQSATAGYLAQMSEDTGTEIVGRLTGIQLGMDIIVRRHEEQITLAQSMEELTMVGLSHLSTIAQNTNELYEMNRRLEKIEKNTR